MNSQARAVTFEGLREQFMGKKSCQAAPPSISQFGVDGVTDRVVGSVVHDQRTATRTPGDQCAKLAHGLEGCGRNFDAHPDAEGREAS